jgi:hypothetical protein
MQLLLPEAEVASGMPAPGADDEGAQDYGLVM